MKFSPLSLLLAVLVLPALPLAAQEGEVLPPEGPAPAVDTITPVPAPEIPFGSIEAAAMKPPMAAPWMPRLVTSCPPRNRPGTGVRT